MESGVLAVAYVQGSSTGPIGVGTTPPVPPVSPVIVGGNTIQWHVGTLTNPKTMPYVYELAFRAQVTSAVQVEDGDVLLNMAMLDWADGVAADSEPITVTEPSLDMVKDVRTSNGGNDSLVAADGWVTYTLAIANNGTAAAYDVTITDALPVGLELNKTPTGVSVSDPAGAVITDTNGISATALVWKVSQLNVGGTIAITYVTRLTGWAGAGRWLTNTAWISAFSSLPGDVPGERVYEPVGPRETTVGTPLPRLVKLEQSGSPSADGEATIGETITYTLRYTVPAGVAAYDPVLVDRLPADVTALDMSFVGGSSAGPLNIAPAPAVSAVEPVVSADGRTLTWTLQTITNPLTVDFSYYITFQAKVKNEPAIVAGDVLVNEASFGWSDGVLGHTATDDEPITIVEPDIEIDKVSGFSTVRAGQFVTFTITISNPAPSATSALYDAIVTDTMSFFMDYVGVGPGTPSPAYVSGGWPDNTQIAWVPSITNTGLSSIGVDETLTYEVIARVRENVSSATLITNHVEIVGSSMPGNVPDEREDPTNPRYDGDDAVVLSTLPGTYHKSVVPVAATIGEVVTYSLHFTVPARTAFYMPVITDVLPDGLTYRGTQGIVPPATIDSETRSNDTPAAGETTVQWDLADLGNATDADAPYALVFTTTVDQRYASSTDVLRGDALTNRYRIDWARLPDGSYRTNHPYVTNTVEIVEPRLEILKRVETSDGGDGSLVGPNGLVTYTLVITNDNLSITSPAYEIVVTDSLPVGLELAEAPTFVSVSDPSGAAVVDNNLIGGTSLRWEIAQLNRDGTITINYVTRLNGLADPTDLLTNTAWITGYGSLPGDVSGERDYGPVGPRETTVLLDRNVDLVKLETSGAPSLDGYAVPGETITYTLRYTIPPGTAIHNAVLTDRLPHAVTGLDAAYVSGSSRGPLAGPGTPPVTTVTPVVLNDGRLLSWDLGTISNGTLGPYVYTITFGAEVTNAAALQNGDVTTNYGGLAWTENGVTRTVSDDVAIEILEPALDIIKDVRTSNGGSGSLVAADGWVTYSLVISNSGTAAAYGIGITDSLPVGLVLAKAPTDVFVSDPRGAVITDTNVLSATHLGWDVSQLDVGGSIAITYVTRLNGLAESTALTNTAWITRYGSLPEDGSGERVYGPVGPRETTVLLADPEFSKVEYSASPTPDGYAAPGETITYTLWYTIPAGMAVNEAVITDRLPHAVTDLDVAYVSGSSQGPIAGSGTPPVPSVTPSVLDGGRVLRWDLGAVNNPTTQPYVYAIAFRAQVTNALPVVAGRVTVNSAWFMWNDGGVERTLTDTEPIEIIEPVLTLSKEVRTSNGGDGSQIAADGWVTYTLLIPNNGTAAAYDVVVSDVLPVGLGLAVTPSSVSVSDPSTTVVTDAKPIGADSLVWRISQLNVGGYITISYLTQMNGLAGAGGWLTNTARLTEYGSVPGYAPGERIYGPTVPQHTTVGTPLAEILKTETSGNPSADGEATIGEMVTYTLRYTIPAGTAAYSPVLVDRMPDDITVLDLTYVSSYGPIAEPPAPSVSAVSPAVASDGKTVTWTLQTITNPTTSPYIYYISFQAKVNNDPAIDAGDMTINGVTLLWNDGTVTHSDSDDEPIAIVEPDIAINKISSDTTVEAGQLVTFTIAMDNLAPAATSPLFDVTVTDTVCAFMDYVGVGLGTPLPASISGGGTDCLEVVWRPSVTNTGLYRVDVGGTVVYELIARVSDQIASGQTVRNEVETLGSSMPGEVTGERRDPTNPRYDDQDEVTLDTAAGTYHKSGVPVMATIGQPITYSLYFTVPARTRFYSPVLTDVLPDGLTYRGTAGLNPPSPFGPISVLDDTPLPGETTIQWLADDVDNSTGTNMMYEMVFTATVDQAYAGGSPVSRGDVLENRYSIDWGRQPGGSDRTHNPFVTETIGIVEPQLTITKDVDPTVVEPGDAITYTVVIENAGNSTAYDVPLTDTLPVGISFGGVVAPPGADPDVTINPIVWNEVGPIGVGASVIYIYTATVDPGVPEGASLSNVVTTTYSSLDGEVPGERRYAPEDATSTVTVLAPNLVLTKTLLSKRHSQVGEEVAWQVEVLNDGSGAAVRVDITDTIPPGFSYVSGSTSATWPGSSYTGDPSGIPGPDLRWNTDARLNPGDTMLLNFRSQVGLGVSPGVYFNVAAAEGEDIGGGPRHSNLDDDYVIVTRPGLEVSKSVVVPSNGVAVLGEQVTFTLRLTNTGTTSLTQIMLTDTFDSGYLSFVRAQPAESSHTGNTISWVFTPLPPLEPDQFMSVDVTFDTLTTTQRTTDTVRVQGTDYNGDPVPGDEDTEPVRITWPSYALIKTLVEPANGIAVVGGAVRFNVVLSNTGDTALTTVPLVDTYDTTYLYYDWSNPPSNDNVNDGRVDWTNIAVAAPGGRILPGDSVAVSVYFTAVAATPLETVNFVTATNVVDEYGDPVADGSDSEPVRITDPKFIVQKTLVGSSLVRVTDIITFDIWITNSGTTTLTVIPLVDTFEPQYLSYRWASPVGPDSESPAGTLTWNDLTLHFGDLAPAEGLHLSTAFYVEYQPNHNSTSNVATVSGATDENGDVLPDQNDHETVEVLTPGLHLQKHAGVAHAPAEVGDPITYTLCISNDGSAPGVGVILTDMVPANTKYVAGSAHSFAPSIPGESLQYYDGALWSGDEPENVEGVRWLVPVLMSDTVGYCTRFQVTINHTWTTAVAIDELYASLEDSSRVSGLAAPLGQATSTAESPKPTSTVTKPAPTAEPAPPTEESPAPTDEPVVVTEEPVVPTEEPTLPTDEPATPTEAPISSTGEPVEPTATSTRTAKPPTKVPVTATLVPTATVTVVPTATLLVSPTATLVPSPTPIGEPLIAVQLERGQTYRLLARDGSLSLDIPAGGVAQESKLLVDYADTALTTWPAHLRNVGKGIYVFSGYTEFLEPIQVSVRYEQSAMEEVNEERLALYSATNGTWVPLPSRLDQGEMSVSAETDRLEWLALLGEASVITATPLSDVDCGANGNVGNHRNAHDNGNPDDHSDADDYAHTDIDTNNPEARNHPVEFGDPQRGSAFRCGPSSAGG